MHLFQSLESLIVFLSLTSLSYANLARWVGDGECPWKDQAADSSHPSHDYPDTGETRYYEFTISRAVIAPDGVDKPGIVVNGQYPGPLIEANWGDWIEVVVRNEIWGPEEPTSIHWHGMNMPGTPWYDGTPVTSQCPIIPGTNLTYRIRADEYGTSWYHAHVAAQYSQGVVGPILIHGPSEHVDYDEDLGPVIFSDWYHRDYTELMAQALAVPKTLDDLRPLADSHLIAGAGRYPCENITDGRACKADVPYARYAVEAGKTYRMRCINTGSSSFFSITLENHEFTVIANDFVPVQPYKTDKIILGVGQRMDVVFTANQDASQAYWLRAFNSELCADTQADSDGFAMVDYTSGGAGSNLDPPTPRLTPSVPSAHMCATDDISLLQPMYPIPVSEPDLTLTIHWGVALLPTGQARWTANNSTFAGSASLFRDPILHQLLASPTRNPSTYPPEYNLISTSTARQVRIVMYSDFIPAHPLHLHGHDFQVLAEGRGEWDGVSIVNPSNPVRRDVVSMPFGANVTDPTVGVKYAVIQFAADNPGAWPLHCHVAWHLTAGMAAVVVERIEELDMAHVPEAVLETCRVYNAWADAQAQQQQDQPGGGGWGEEGPSSEGGARGGSSNSTKGLDR